MSCSTKITSYFFSNNVHNAVFIPVSVKKKDHFFFFLNGELIETNANKCVIIHPFSKQHGNYAVALKKKT